MPPPLVSTNAVVLLPLRVLPIMTLVPFAGAALSKFRPPPYAVVLVFWSTTTLVIVKPPLPVLQRKHRFNH